MKNIHIYAALVIVFLVSFFSAVYFQYSVLVAGMMATPGVAALFGALFQIARDASFFEKQMQLQDGEHVFALGVTSHMSSVAFDKHVEFCESYMMEVHETIIILFREGPTQKAMDCAQKLWALKKTYAAWIPKSVGIGLEPFEDALNKIGATSHLVEALSSEGGSGRVEAINESFNIFANVMGIKKIHDDAPDHSEEIAIEYVKDKVRDILGINELFEIREFVVKKSVEFARTHSK